MNVVVLTPDRVGSTLLQRLITIYMQLADFDQPVINLHELTNGLMPYWSDVFNQEVLTKPQDWDYHQSLGEIIRLLENARHYKTSRLAHYHIRRREDSIAQQLPFYEYINDNFFVIAARRSDLLEHALSWCIYTQSRRLNVYSAQEKFQVFADIYQDGVTVSQETLTKYLDDYCSYLSWVDRHFRVNSYFNYETDMPNIEKYILGLDIFSQRKSSSWQQGFGIEFGDWNRCHYLCSDMSSVTSPLLLGSAAKPRVEYSLATVTRSLPQSDQLFLAQKGMTYQRTQRHIQELVDKKILVTGVPIKLQTRAEKRRLIRNWTEVVEWYNEWVQRTGQGEPHSDRQQQQLAITESKIYHCPTGAGEKDDAPHESLHLTNGHQQG